MSLQDWERNGWLQRHQTSPNKIRHLLGVVERERADSATESRRFEWARPAPELPLDRSTNRATLRVSGVRIGYCQSISEVPGRDSEGRPSGHGDQSRPEAGRLSLREPDRDDPRRAHQEVAGFRPRHRYERAAR